MIDEDSLLERKAAILPHLNERQRRLFAAAEAKAAGHGGIATVSRVTGIAASTIGRGLKELAALSPPLPGRVRRSGGGRKSLTEKDHGLLDDLNALVEPDVRGDPMSPLRWTCKSLRRLAAELNALGHKISHTVVGELLKTQKFSLQANCKTKEGADNPDRDAQFRFINDAVETALAEHQPVISVDTKKELVGDFKNAGREWRPQGQPQEVRMHDFPDPKMNKAIPYGVYDLTRNEGWVSLGIDHDTARFAAASIQRWWKKMGRRRYPQARELLITADCGGSNSSRTRLWKVVLQELADDLGLALTVCHFPPGTSKWNKIEHRMFCHITQNWRGRPLINYATIVQLIGNTRTTTGLKVRAELDDHEYPTKELVTPEQLARVQLTPAAFHGEWNYTIAPQ
jgi:hypothetical protein